MLSKLTVIRGRYTRLITLANQRDPSGELGMYLVLRGSRELRRAAA